MSWPFLAVVVCAAPLELSSLGDGSGLSEVVWRQAPGLSEAREKVTRAEAERRKALRLPNPGLDVGLNTLPVGPSNPVDLPDPWLNTPNLGVGVSWLIELGKRGPRQEALAETARAAALEALELLRQRVFELEDVIGDVASAQLRVASLRALGDDARRLAELQAARAAKGDASELDVDRARLEAETTFTSVADAEAELAEQLRRCAAHVAGPCLPFSDAAHAQAWLDRPFTITTPLEARPDVQALEASARAARSNRELARRQWLPDPTVRVGYVRDQFVVSGNQQNSLFVGFSLPLPFFEHGADDAEAAAALARLADDERTRRLGATRARLERLEREVEVAEARQQRIANETLPLARSVVARLDAAVARGSAPLQELLFARRTLTEVLLAGAELDRAVFHLRVERARLTQSFPSPGDVP